MPACKGFPMQGPHLHPALGLEGGGLWPVLGVPVHHVGPHHHGGAWGQGVRPQLEGLLTRLTQGVGARRVQAQRLTHDSTGVGELQDTPGQGRTGQGSNSSRGTQHKLHTLVTHGTGGVAACCRVCSWLAQDTLVTSAQPCMPAPAQHTPGPPGSCCTRAHAWCLQQRQRPVQLPLPLLLP